MKAFNVFVITLFVFITFSACKPDKREWNKAVNANTIESFEQFKLKFPESIYSDSAQLKIEELAFNDALLRNNITDYRSFIEKHPESSLVKMADNKIAELELSEAFLSKDILRIIDKINLCQESQPVKDMMLKERDSLVINSKNSIDEAFITKVMFSEKRNIIHFIIPPEREIKYETGEILDGLEVIKGEIIGILSIEARDMIQDQSGDEGCTLKVTCPKNELLYALSDILVIDKDVYIKIADNTYLYSIDDQTKLERILKPNTFIVTGGKVYLIQM